MQKSIKFYFFVSSSFENRSVFGYAAGFPGDEAEGQRTEEVTGWVFLLYEY